MGCGGGDLGGGSPDGTWPTSFHGTASMADSSEECSRAMGKEIKPTRRSTKALRAVERMLSQADAEAAALQLAHQHQQEHGAQPQQQVRHAQLRPLVDHVVHATPNEAPRRRGRLSA